MASMNTENNEKCKRTEKIETIRIIPNKHFLFSRSDFTEVSNFHLFKARIYIGKDGLIKRNKERDQGRALTPRRRRCKMTPEGAKMGFRRSRNTVTQKQLYKK